MEKKITLLLCIKPFDGRHKDLHHSIACIVERPFYDDKRAAMLCFEV